MTKAQIMNVWRNMSKDRNSVMCACSLGVYEWVFDALFKRVNENVYLRAGKWEATLIAGELLDGQATITVNGEIFELEDKQCAA
jgi:hypothetical protein